MVEVMQLEVITLESTYCIVVLTSSIICHHLVVYSPNIVDRVCIVNIKMLQNVACYFKK